MARYADISNMVEWLNYIKEQCGNKYPNYETLMIYEIEDCLENLPGIVTCEQCKHYLWSEFDGCYVCMQLNKYVKPDFWCAYGERKNND